MTGGGGERPAGCRLLVSIAGAVEDRYPVEVSVVDPTGTVLVSRQGALRYAELPNVPGIAVANQGANPIPLGKVGEALFELLCKAGLNEFWTPDDPVRLVLDIRPQELSMLPWELLRDPENGPLFAARDAPAVRGRLPFPRSPAEVGVPIRLLVIVGDPADDAELRQDEEIEAIHAGLRGAPCCWHVDVLRGPDQRQLLVDYPDLAPDILHVIGHGTPTAFGNSVRIAPPGGPPWKFSAEYLTDALPRKLMPQLAVLNACRTSDKPHESVQLARGLTDGFLGRGSAAVVAMQGDVGSDPAVLFTEAFYRRLADREPLDVAVAGARVEVRNTTKFDSRDWVLPVLELRADPASVLRQPRRLEPLVVMRRHHGFGEVAHLIDRAPQRRTVHQRTGEPNGLLFVTGESGIGKSLLIRSWVVARAVSGAAVIYHSLGRGPRASATDFLLGLVETAGRWLGDRAEPLCRDTATALCTVLRQAEPGWSGAPVEVHPPWAEPARPGVPLPRLYTPPRPGIPHTPVDEAYSIVRDLLVNLARAEPLVLVLDQVSWIDEQGAFVRGLLEPASRDELLDVRIVVVEETLKGLAGGATGIPITADRLIPVPAFVRADAVALTREYLARFHPEGVDEGKWQAVRDYMIGWATTERADTQFEQLQPIEIPHALRGRMLKVGLLAGLVDW